MVRSERDDMSFKYKWRCENPNCQCVRESDNLKHGDKPCSKCKSKMVRMEKEGDE
jgi:hypothetical protein